MNPYFYLPAIMLLFLFCPADVSGQSSDCTTSGCHADMLQGNVVHMPVQDGACDICHTQTQEKHPQPKGEEFVLESEDISQVCGNCHDVPTDEPDLHTPVAEGMCTTCHDPHHSSLPALLTGQTSGEVCGECHDTGMEDKKFVHGPVVTGACIVCHKGHGRVKNALLPAEGEVEVCYQCHLEKKQELASFEHIHDPVVNSCVSCHNPHESDYRFQLNDQIPSLCYSCHEDVSDIVNNASSKHDALLEGKKCLNCHAPHGADYPFDLQQDPFTLCLSCHDRPLKSGEQVITNMKELLEKNTDWHGPIREKDCSGCHNPHGSSNMRLLTFYFSPKFYSPFDVKNYQLCFQCHEEKNVLDENTKSTNFRDGTRNLHFLHVNQKKGRTCRACHQVHASGHPFHIRDSVPFGRWELPINYSPDANGGSCTPGCHKRKVYRR